MTQDDIKDPAAWARRKSAYLRQFRQLATGRERRGAWVEAACALATVQVEGDRATQGEVREAQRRLERLRAVMMERG